ncbi:MAG: PDZ domain-containing protein [Fimbriimonadales bacterium]|nr:PDZ domain-containing protein [Fimbriimonadales bacterium]
MRRLFGLLLGLALLSSLAVQAQGRAALEDALRRDIERARDKVFPALVNILVVNRYFEGGRAQYALGGGSGVIVSPDGLVLTNYHVASDAVRLFCTLTTGERLEAEALWHDAMTDLSVLRLKAPANSPKREFPYAQMGDSDALKTGDYVLAMGNPLLLASSVTLGIVSNPKRVFLNPFNQEIEGAEFERGDRSGMLTRWIQHDALILPGNSGGPLVNLQGEVVGINQLGGGGIGFAIPSRIARSVLEQVRRTGRVERGWLGFRAMPVEKLRRTDGVLVASVTPNSPAESAGIQPGDVIVRIDGKPVSARFPEEIPLVYLQIAELPIGKLVPIELLRNGEQRTVQVRVERMEPYYGEEDEFRTLGFTARDITRPMARASRLPEEGVQITGIRPGYPLDTAEPKLNVGDAIVQFGERKIRNLKDLREAIEAHREQENIPIVFQRRTETLITVIRNRPPSPPSLSTELPKAWLGVRTQVITQPVAQALGDPNLKGFRITEVLPYTEASKAGLQVGDLIVALNDEPLEAFRTQDARDLERRIERMDIGAEAKLTVVRNGERREIRVKLEPSPASAEAVRSIRQNELDFAVRDITALDRMRNRWREDQQGVLVTDVPNGGWAQLGGLRNGDLILAVNEQPIQNLQDFQQVMQTVVQQQPPVVILYVLRDRETSFVFIEPDWKEITQ